MEISEEDDSLIKQYPDSPSSLIRIRSSEKPRNNKENINSNNVQVPNLGMKPMHMKSRKKGSGYNLRKSLAWDRAFFTDEGILDPLELTLITGINANTCLGELATISEQGNSSGSRFRNDHDDKEEALYKESHDTTCTLKGNREKTDSSVGNHDSLPHHKVTHKVLSINRTNRAGSKVGGCSEPLAASSLKRPANSSIMRTAKKESKLPKIPISKPGSCLSAMTKGSIAPSHLRHNPIPKPTINAKKNVGFKSYVKNVHDSQSKAKMGSGSVHLPTKELAKRTVRDLTKSSSKATSSTKSRLVRADRSNSGSDMVPDRLQFCKFEKESAPLAATNLAQQTTTNADNSLPEATRLISSGHCHNQRASNGLMISDKLHPFKSQERPAALVPHHVNPNNAGVPSHIQPAGPSGLRLPSPSLRFFDQKTTSECGSLKQKKFEQLNTNMGSNRKIGELRPPAVPARTPLKINDIKENICSAPSMLSTSSGSTQLSPSPKYVGNTSNVVPVSNIYTNLERKRVDIEVQYECRGSELESHEVIEQDKRNFGREEIMETEKISHSTVQLGEGTGATIHFSRNVGYNEVGVGTLQLMSEGNDARVPFFTETKDKCVLHIEEDRLQSYTAISMSKCGQSIQHEEHNLSTAIKGTTDFIHDIARISGEQSDIEKSVVLKVNPKYHLDVGSLEAEDWVSEVFVDSQKDQVGKREDNVGPNLERHSSVMQHENIGQENDVAKAVDNKSLPMNDDARWNTDSPCGGTTGRISITSRDFIQDIAQTSREQSDTEKSDAPKVYPESQLGVGSLEAEDRVGEVFVDLQKDQSGKREDNVGTGLKNSAFLQDENVGQDNDVAKAVVDKSLTLTFDARCNTDCPCSGTKERISITSIDFMQDIAQTSGEQSDAEKSDAPMVNSESHLDNGSPEAEDWVSQVFVDSQTDRTGKREDDVCVGLEKYSAVLQQETIGQENDVAKAVDDKSLPMEDDDSAGSGTMGKISITPRESPKDEGENGGNTDATKSRYQFHSEGRSVSCIMPAESSALDEGPYANATENFQEKSGSSYLGAIFLEVPDEKQDVQPLAEDLEYREVAPLIDDREQFSLSRPRVELPSGTASLGDGESMLQVAQYGSTYPTNLEKEGLDIVPAATEAEHKVHEDQKNQVMGIITGSFSEESVVAENSQHSHDNILEANPIVQITEGSVTINNFSKTHVEDSQLHLLDGEMLVQSCSRLTSELHSHSIQDVDHSDIFGKQPELSNTGIELEKVSRSNQLLNNTINFQQEYVFKAVKDVVGQSDVYECDPKPSNIDASAPTVGQEVGFHLNSKGQPCVESVTSGSTVIDSVANYDGNCNDRQFKECGDLLLGFESSGKDKMFGVNTTCMGYYSPLEESCSFPREIVDSMLQEKETLFGEFADIEQVSADNDAVFMKDSSSSEKISNSNKANNFLDSVVSEQSISYGCNVQTSCASVQILPMVQVNVYDVNGDNMPNEAQGFDVIMPLMDTYDYFTNGQSNSSFTVSQQLNTGVTATCTTLCSATADLCSDAGGDESMLTSTYRIGDEGSKISIGEEIDAGVFQEGKSSMEDELHHDSDSGGDLKRNKDTTVLSKKPNNIKRQDNSLVIHPPNAVPFSDEWLAAIEAAGEEILTMKCGAVQHSPPDKSLPEPSPWSPVKKKTNQIGPYDCTKYTNAMPSNPH